MTLHEKIFAIMRDVQYLKKDDNVKFAQTDYMALSEEKVTVIMREECLKYGIVVYPIEMQSSRNGNITHVDVKYRLVNTEDPIDYIDVVSCGDGADTQDKGSGKAMTYAYKYMWLRTFALPTGEDPDKISSEQIDMTCEKCKKIIEAAKDKTGNIITAESVAVISRNKFNGKTYCAECQKALFAEYKSKV